MYIRDHHNDTISYYWDRFIIWIVCSGSIKIASDTCSTEYAIEKDDTELKNILKIIKRN